MQKITPVILSGGMGTRLWPLSRRRHPKQFQPIDGPGSMSFLQSTILRHIGPLYENPVIVGAASDIDILRQQVAGLDLSARLIAEPMGRNTGPAVLAAALDLVSRDPDALILVLPSDHVIRGEMDPVMDRMRLGAERGRIVTFGVPPRHAETGFGYIMDGGAAKGVPGLREVETFVEKPSRDYAERLIRTGRAFWASGISMMRADVLIAEFARLEPDTLDALRAAVDGGTREGDVLGLEPEAFAKALNEPTERAIFERSEAIALAELDVYWNDVGAWNAVYEIGQKSASGNVETGEVVTIETHNSLIRADGDRLITVLGMEGVIVIDTPDALLVTNHAYAQHVKEAVGHLKRQRRLETETYRRSASRAREIEVPLSATEWIEGSAPGGTMVILAAGEARIETAGVSSQAMPGAHVYLKPGHRVGFRPTNGTALSLVAIQVTASPQEVATRAPVPDHTTTGRPGKLVA